MARRSSGDGDDLYAVPPSEFTRARNALVIRLRERGNDAEARRVAKLRKPTAVVSAINRTARKHTDDVATLIQSVERLRRAHARTPNDLSEPQSAHRAALARLIGLVTGELGAGRSPDVARRVSGTLLAAAADPESQAELRHGRLTRELEPPGFEALTGLRPRHLRLVSPPAKPAPAARDGRRDEAAARRIAAKKTEKAQRAAQRAAAAATRQASRLEARATTHEAAAARGLRSADRLRARLQQLEERAAREREAAATARQQAARLRGT
jgi:hypothetical protein